MKFWEAMKALEDGKKIVFGASEALAKDLDAMFQCFDGVDYQIVKKFMTREDYRLYSEPVKTYSFQEIVHFLKQGKKVKRNGWDFQIYKGMDECLHVYELGRGKFCIKLEEFEANDWIIAD